LPAARQPDSKLGQEVSAVRSLSRAIDRFCLKHRRFGLPRLMTYIVFVSAAVFVISLMDETRTLLDFLSFHPYLIIHHGQLWRLVTWVFLPVNSQLIFVAITLYFYYFIGSTLEREWGAGKFTIYYLFGVALNIVYGFAVWFLLGLAVPVIPNFLNLSMFFAFAVLFPDQIVRLFFVLPIKVKWLALVNAAYFAFAIVSGLVTGRAVLALLPLVALLNFFIVCGDDALSYLRPLKVRASPQTINFKKAAKQARRDQDSKHYRHKCAICGKTDSEFPDLEFRYCSRCEGYHCYCIDHINNHMHLK